MLTLLQKCASWKSPEFSSKMRTLFQGAHRKVRIYDTVQRLDLSPLLSTGSALCKRRPTLSRFLSPLSV
jgi:hypothetical protein